MNKRLSFALEIAIGIVLVGIGYFLIADNYYSSLIGAFGIALCSSGAFQLIKIHYYELPQNKQKLEIKKQQDHIDSIDERKILLRMKAGSMVYQLTTLGYMLAAFVLALLHIEVWAIALLFGLCVLQFVLGTVLYKYFEKRF